MYSRDILVASVDKTKAKINTTATEEIISSVKTKFTSCYQGYCYQYGSTMNQCYDVNRNAQEVYDTIPTETRNCSIYGSVGVDSWVDLHYQGLDTRLVHHRTPGTNSYSIHLFG